MLCPGGSWAALIRAVLLCDMGGQDLDERQPVREGPGNQFIGPNYQAANPVRRHCRQRETAVRRVGSGSAKKRGVAVPDPPATPSGWSRTVYKPELF